MSKRPSGRVTLVDIAKEANCSVSLVSIVMRGAPGASEQTRARVKAVADRLGYRPDQRARSLRRARSGLIGVTFNVLQPFHADLVEGLYEAVTATDYELVLGAVVAQTDDIAAAEPLLRDRCEALIMLGPTAPPARLAALAAEVPVVMVARPSRIQGIDVVRVDDRGGLRLVVEHLTSLGHERIVLVDGGKAPGVEERIAGYREAMTAAGLEEHIRVIGGGLDEEDGRRAAVEILELDERPTAIAAFNDRCASGVVNHLLTRGVYVPRDMSVVGFDDSRQATRCIVPLTTVAQDTVLMARTALERAIGRATNRYLPTEQVLVPRLVVRNSTSAQHR
ncbi:LacI family DNA-binding transcriptional regulator [Actinomyces ruminicola]|uniref:Transcriptional regulator, LacI family n=1 Tax=Actinomyces ruminicola TaxID=332524 RepID=A0A1G9XN05_9ACTO|nr:LacI family DNA-binding transcriptional regulator [Actinomyces ruminicola]SDM98212.1 transcriptional regulator, LacI family [Actinomyces ruminicola]